MTRQEEEEVVSVSALLVLIGSSGRCLISEAASY